MKTKASIRFSPCRYRLIKGHEITQVLALAVNHAGGDLAAAAADPIRCPAQLSYYYLVAVGVINIRAMTSLPDHNGMQGRGTMWWVNIKSLLASGLQCHFFALQCHALREIRTL